MSSKFNPNPRGQRNKVVKNDTPGKDGKKTSTNVESGLNEIQQMNYMLERRRQLNVRKIESQYSSNSSQTRNRSRHASASGQKFASTRQSRASQFQVGSPQRQQQQPQLVRTYFRFNNESPAPVQPKVQEPPKKQETAINFSNQRLPKNLNPQPNTSQFAPQNSYFKSNKDEMDVDSQTSDQVSFSSDYHSAQSSFHQDEFIQPQVQTRQKSLFSVNLQGTSSKDDQEEENSIMSNSFEEDQSAKKDPVSDEKVVDRFAGNIAESDDDYDEEDISVKPKKSNQRISENYDPKPEAKSSFFTPAPAIIAKEIVKEKLVPMNVFGDVGKKKSEFTKRKFSHDNAGSSSDEDDNKQKPMVVNDGSFIDIDVDEDNTVKQKEVKYSFNIDQSECLSPASITQRNHQNFNHDKIRQGSIDSMFSLQPKLGLGQNIDKQQRQNSVFVEDTHMKQIRQIFKQKNNPSTFNRNTTSIANQPNNSYGPHTLSQKSAEASNHNSRNTNTDPSDNSKNQIGNVSGFANPNIQQSKSSSNESQIETNKKKTLVAQAKTVDEKLQLLYKNQKDHVVSTNLASLQSQQFVQQNQVPVPKPPVKHNSREFTPIMSNNSGSNQSSLNSSLRARDNPNRTTSLFNTFEPLGNIGRTNIQGFRQISGSGTLSGSQSHPILQGNHQFQSPPQNVMEHTPLGQIFPQTISPMNRENQIMKFSDRLDQKIIDDSGNNLLTDNSLTIQSSFNEDNQSEQQKKKNLHSFHNDPDDTSSIIEVRPFNNRSRPAPKEPRMQSPIKPLVAINEDVPFYPEMLESQKLYSDQFNQQFGDIIGKNLKKKLKPMPNMQELQAKFAKSPLNSHKKTLILPLDNCLLKTSIFKDELPRIDGLFTYQKLKILVCFRNFTGLFLKNLQKEYEIIAWQSSQLDYSEKIIDIIETNLKFKFDHKLSLIEQNPSEDNSYYVKNIDILTGVGNRNPSDIVVVDSQMSNFTNKLTNGIYLPPYSLHDDKNDKILQTLGHYLLSLCETPDVRAKIKVDFDLLTKFNGFKQNQAFMKIAQRTQEESGLDYKQELNKHKKSGDSPQNQNEWFQLYSQGGDGVKPKNPKDEKK